MVAVEVHGVAVHMSTAADGGASYIALLVRASIASVDDQSAAIVASDCVSP